MGWERIPYRPESDLNCGKDVSIKYLDPELVEWLFSPRLTTQKGYRIVEGPTFRAKVGIFASKGWSQKAATKKLQNFSSPDRVYWEELFEPQAGLCVGQRLRSI